MQNRRASGNLGPGRCGGARPISTIARPPGCEPSLMQADGDQIGQQDRSDTPPSQITGIGESGSPMAPIVKGGSGRHPSPSLTPTERRVLLQAIEGNRYL